MSKYPLFLTKKTILSSGSAPFLASNWKVDIYMPLNQKDIDELKEIHKREFGEELPNEEAWEMGINLINLFKVIVRDGDKEE